MPKNTSLLLYIEKHRSSEIHPHFPQELVGIRSLSSNFRSRQQHKEVNTTIIELICTWKEWSPIQEDKREMAEINHRSVQEEERSC